MDSSFSSSSSSSSTTNASVGSSSSISANLNHGLPVKLDPNNFLLWKIQMENVIIVHGLEGFIDGTNLCPSQFLNQENRTTLNPLYTAWQRQDKFGHIAINCYHRFDNINYKPTNSNNSNKMAAMISTPEVVSNTAWFMDSGATHHITPNVDNLNSTNPFHGHDKLAVGDGNKNSITYTGYTSLSSNSISHNLHLNNVLCVPKISLNLISVNKLCHDNNVFLEFHPSFFLIKDANLKKVILQGKLEHGLYTIKPTKRTCFSATK
ncbi:hypothetical protein UlMin_004396 [Ulmus minor]